jgi:ADP-ribosylglycohydrolase
MELLNRYRGAMLGLAAGDALGTTLEFQPRGTFEPIIDMVGGGPFGLEPGQWTDDTSMALCLAESLIEQNDFDPADQMQRYVRWWRHGHWSSTGRCFDIGNTVSHALRIFERTGEPLAGSTDPQSAGNGSLMRLAAVVLRHARNPAEAIRLAAESWRSFACCQPGRRRRHDRCGLRTTRRRILRRRRDPARVARAAYFRGRHRTTRDATARAR